MLKNEKLLKITLHKKIERNIFKPYLASSSFRKKVTTVEGYLKVRKKGYTIIAKISPKNLLSYTINTKSYTFYLFV